MSCQVSFVGVSGNSKGGWRGCCLAVGVGRVVGVVGVVGDGVGRG